MYDVNNFLLKSLEDVGYLSEEFKNNESLKERLTDFAMLTVGTNPRSLKRLINTLSLLNIIDNNKKTGNKKDYELALNFGLVCIQIAYPKIYQALIDEPDFKSWNEKIAKKMRLDELTETQLNVLKLSPEFDEEWEIVLYRICQKETFLAARAFQVSSLLSFISEIIPDNLDLGDEISRIIGTCSVTNVHLDYNIKPKQKNDRIRYEGWLGFENMLKDNKQISNFVPTLKIIHDYFEVEYANLALFNYTPNFLTIACKFPNSRKKTFIFIRLKKDAVMIEFAGQAIMINKLEDFTDEIKLSIKNQFNELSQQPKQ